MLFVSIPRPELLRTLSHRIDGVELRLDLFPSWDLDLVRKMLSQVTCPIMLTIRQCGSCSEAEREARILDLLGLKPPFIDLEYDMRRAFLESVLTSYPETQFVLSYHNFACTPDDLEEIYQAMAVYPAYQYKIAAMAHSTHDALRMLLFARSHPRCSAITMGEKGVFGRILGPIAGNALNYASIDVGERTAPGQLTAQEWFDLYHYPSLNKNTSIYGLIGDPVDGSSGHIYHNGVFRKRGLNAVYVKMSVKPEELSEFIPLAIAMGMRGLSVTMPLKEKIFPFVDEMDPAAKQIGAINTLLLQNGKILGTNTDGLGALDAIEQRTPVHRKKIILLGAGGAARAIAFQAKARGADVLILNRTIERAKELAAMLGCQAGGLDEVPNDYDLMINCSPSPVPIDPQAIRPHTWAMDIVRSPRETAFLKEAALKHCQIVYGEEMFLNQAERQTAFWLAGGSGPP